MGWLDSLLGGGGAYKKAGNVIQAGYDKAIGKVDAANAQTGAEFSPYLAFGRQGLSAYGDALGLNGLDRAAQARNNFQFSPGYQFALGEMNRNTLNGGGATGSLLSGDTLKGLQTNANGLANQEWGGYLDRLSGVTDLGANMTANKGSLNARYGEMLARLLSEQAQGKASAIIGKSNAQKGFLGDVFSAAGSLFGLG